MNNNVEKGEEDVPTALRMSRILKEKVVPDLLADGTLGEGWQVDDVRNAPIGGLGQDHFASTTLTTSVDLSRTGGEKRSVSLVSKCMVPGETNGEFFDVDAQADNEVNMYNKVFPFFQKLASGSDVPVGDVFPKSYWARSHWNGVLSLTVMEDLREKGFRLAKERTALDREHVVLALRAIGRMHAWSYAAKARCRDEFLQRVVPLLRESCYNERWRVEMAPMMKRVVHRGIDLLEERLRQDGDTARLAKLRRMSDVVGDVYSVMTGASAPREPVAVIAHGDFCRNNMQFRYGEGGRPEEVCLFDFQNSKYCSPALDLSFFLFMNTSPELRATQWDALLQEYYDSLRSTVDRLLEGHDVHPDFVMPTLQTVRDELKSHALYGYVIVAFFLPQMMTPPEEQLPIEEVKEMLASNPDALLDLMLQSGGKAANEVLTTVVREFVDMDLIP